MACFLLINSSLDCSRSSWHPPALRQRQCSQPGQRFGAGEFPGSSRALCEAGHAFLTLSENALRETGCGHKARQTWLKPLRQTQRAGGSG